MKSHFIFYVSDQERSAQFYEKVLAQKPSLNVPGMTEFELNKESVLGLMPSRGIKKLLGETIPDPEIAGKVPRAELYLVVDHPEEYHKRAVEAGATELSNLQLREWGHQAAYISDPDGHVIAFASD